MEQKESKRNKVNSLSNSRIVKTTKKKEETPKYIKDACQRLFQHVTHNRAVNSCGIEEIEGFSRAFRDTYLGLSTDTQKEQFMSYLENNFKKELNLRVKNGCFKTISLVTKYHYDFTVDSLVPKERMEAMLDKHASHFTESRKNKNSNNMIKLWVF